jgi:hypothetical protein
MGATSVLGHRPPPVSKVELQLVHRAFAAQGSDGRTEEIVEILHFLAWAK